MVQFYLKLVQAGKLDIESVPAKYREKVRAYYTPIHIDKYAYTL